MQKVDMMVAGISATAERERVVDFTFPFYHDSVRNYHLGDLVNAVHKQTNK